MDFLQVLREFGFPTAIIVAAGLGGWVALRWIAGHVAQPLVQSHVRLMRHLEANTSALKIQGELQASLLAELVAMERAEHDEQRNFYRDWADFRGHNSSLPDHS